MHKRNQKGSGFCLHVCLSCCALLFCLWLNLAVAESPENRQADTTDRIYAIPAGSLLDSLKQFSQQAGIDLIYDPVLLEGVKTQGLDGKFDVASGLNFLLIGTGYRFVEQAHGFEIIAAQVSGGLEISGSQAGGQVTVLPTIQISASNTGSYAATSSVTATKTNTLLRDVPQSITVVTEELIKDQAIQSLGDAVRYVPGVGVSQGEGNRDALVFRGNRSTGDFFVDGIRDDVAFFRDLYNIERIEVLKGANGMIFGRGGSGGVVNRVTKQANWNPVREFSFQGGSFNKKRMTGDFGHVFNDMVAFRVNGLFEDSDSFRDGVVVRRRGVSPTVTIRPTDRTKVVVNMERFHDDRTADRGIPSDSNLNRPVDVKRSLFFGDPKRSHSDAEVLSFNALIEHRFDFGVTLSNRTNYAQYDKFYQNIFSRSPALDNRVFLGAYNDATDRENVFNQTNLLYSVDTGPISHTLLAGVEIGQQITSNVRQTGFFNNDPRGISFPVPLNNPVTDVPIAFITRPADADNRSVVDITSLYIQDQIELLPQLQAIAGVRYDLFEVDFRKRNGDTTQINTSDHLISPRFGLIFKPIEPLSIYASYSQAYVPRAGDQLTGIIVTRATLKPEKFTTYEAGIKWDIYPDLALTGAVYRLDRTNVISPTSDSGGTSFLAGEQRTEGIEIGLSGRVTQSLSVMGGYAYQDGEITSATEEAEKGATIAELPRNTFSMWSRYDFTPRIGAAVGVIYRSSMFAAVDNTVRVPDFTRVDAALFAQFTRQVRGQINIENLFDTHYFASVHNNNNITPGSPIAVRATLVANF
ncbi:TonB-dependent siderophore receptor [Nitrosomonas sp.]|uniref:TonB-dependent receptor n=1 Tax=Nitrosomonas sp. TaxID=42353 RepID=UPI002850B313|nr:TonB-dependent siderophore receptor [Nitrosomonas sp.]MDR4515645.1 TonB-dependent siderophore receptor [Nitrosomonas sp.]